MDCLSRWIHGAIRYDIFLDWNEFQSTCSKLDVEENPIGTKVITRSLTNEFEPEDITDRYKNPAEPPEERDTLNNRLKNDVNYEILVSEENRVRFFFFSFT